MEIVYRIIALLGGLAMFLYGMRVMGDGLKASSGGAMKKALAKVINKPILGFILGVFVTCVIQSSTATIVLTVGLVGAGFLNFRQSVGIVLGANVGTAITAQIIRLMDLDSDAGSLIYFFKADNLAPLALIIGACLIMFAKRGSMKNVGNIASGFGVLFMGLIYMSSAVSAFEESLSGLLLAFENNAFLQFLAGVGVTGVIQSSSAVVGIVQSFASSMGVTIKGIFAVIIGVNIGDCLTTYLVSRIGAKPEQARTAMVHVIYNVCAAVLLFAIVGIGRLTGLISDDLWTMSLNSGGVANLHGLFRLVPALCFLPASGLIAKAAERLIPEKEVVSLDEDIENELRELDPRLITSPVMALEQVEHLMDRMSEISVHNYTACVQQIFEFDPARYERINQREDLLDRITDAANQYLISLSPYIKRDRDTRRQIFDLKALVVFERIGDLAVNITENVATIRESDIHFSDNAIAELKVAIEACQEILEITTNAFITWNATLAKRVEPLEEVIDDLVEELNSRHVDRMSNMQCDIFGGIQFQNILTNLEHISDKCSDLAIYIIEQHEPEIRGKEHEYIHNLHHSNDEAFKSDYEGNKEKYFGAIREIPITGPVDASLHGIGSVM